MSLFVSHWLRPIVIPLLAATMIGVSEGDEPPSPIFNRAPLAPKRFAELPLGSIRPEGWLRDELERMAIGMTGHLDQWYPEVCGPRNAWLGGDGDCWERGPYWIDGLYPLAVLLEDEELEAKAMKWIEWTLLNQRSDGQIGPQAIEHRDQVLAPPRGAQITKPNDWWPRMVMLKILQQHYMATGDERVIRCLTNHFRYQLAELPDRPLHDPRNPESGSWWSSQRGGDNLMVVLWLYSLTGDTFLLELADLLHQQTVPVTRWFLPGADNMVVRRYDRGEGGLHSVNVAQMLKTPVVRWQQDQDQRHLRAVKNALRDLYRFHGQPNGLFGGDEELHGDSPDRGSELCTAVEMMFSLEKMFEITGDTEFADQLERVAFNALPTQCSADHHSRQYYQQTNQVEISVGNRDFFDDGGQRTVFGLLHGYPCCTCNLHQGWPKFTQHLWMASQDGGLAVVAYAPSAVETTLPSGQEVNLTLKTDYPFRGQAMIEVAVEQATAFPLHLRIPGWADGSEIAVNSKRQDHVRAGEMYVIKRVWSSGDKVELRFPMPIKPSTWYGNSRCIERGPLVFALPVGAHTTTIEDRGYTGPGSSIGRGYLELHPSTDWNFALTELVANSRTISENVRLEVDDQIPSNPWTPDSAPVRISVVGFRLPYWTINRGSATPPPLSPVARPDSLQPKVITLVPYGATTLRITEFPWLGKRDVPEELPDVNAGRVPFDADQN